MNVIYEEVFGAYSHECIQINSSMYDCKLMSCKRYFEIFTSLDLSFMIQWGEIKTTLYASAWNFGRVLGALFSMAV